MKQCTRCGLVKKLGAFCRRSKSNDGLKPECRSCTADRNRAWRLANPDRVKENNRRWKQANKHTAPSRGRKTKYGIEDSDYQVRLTEQGGRCLICELVMDPPCVDHDHETGLVRGLLCRKCNSAIGLLNDSTDLLQSAIHYLNREDI